jgi:predicted metal-dependent phosphotriesterase family hydrolase
MKRASVIALVVFFVLSSAVVAYAKPDKPTFDRQPGAQAVVDEHIRALNVCDVDALMAQYPESVHIVLPGGVTVEGREDVRDLFEGFCQPYPVGLAGLQFTAVDSREVGKTLNVQWSADACFLAEPYLGADAYETHAGLMFAQVTTFDGAELVENPDWRHDCNGEVKKFYTTAGPLDESEVGNVLAHHHMFVELGADPPVGFLTADREIVNDVIGPWVEEARDLGAGVFVETTPEGVGRRPDIVKYVAEAAELPTMLVTGIYREPFMRDWTFDATVDEIAEFMRNELDKGVEGTDVPGGIIKLSQNATGMTLTERKVLEAACIVARETDAAIASHITGGPTAFSVMDALEGFGCDLERYRFVWIHAQWTAAFDPVLETGNPGHDAGMDYLLAAAERGAYVSLDGIGSHFWGIPGAGGFDENIAWIEQLVDAGYEDQIIIGADTGWFDPGDPPFPGFEIELVDGDWRPAGTAGVDGYLMQDYRSIFEFADAMKNVYGFSDELIKKLMHDNPWNAYSRW